MTIKTILIDDERKALAIIQNKLERFCPMVHIIGKTQDANKGVQLIEELKPDLVFLDIAMPVLNGFDVLNRFPQPNFEVIFVTAFDSYAIEAIKHSVIGYLVKPVDNEDLIKTVDKAIKNIEEKTSLQKNQLLIENLGIETFQNKKMLIPMENGLEFVRFVDILYFEGYKGYTKIHLIDREPILSSYNIGYYNKLLVNRTFYLIHKSYLINLKYIHKYLNEGYIILENSAQLPVSRSRRKDFFNTLRNIKHDDD